ncbi:hypothetical protein [Streptomyces antarcticus]|uniref:hypothetical protein n=1 Tax=Streptomyces antarcticus TaxID=2996458 RepID=UPI00226F514E|nr:MULTISPECIES: hypothetical protein [unclassified Streptomyces]MCY0943036.1 hypothetical protein [Streptomyces sp. H34-AA3]MCZ4087529.1 hypothetical protein [Streptomyces sp. H34-S5]
MHNRGPEQQQRGHVLLIAGDAAVRRRTVQIAPSANLAALGVVPASMLLNSDTPSDTTYLDGARDPNTVLMRLRTAAATPGPLFVYLSGRLTVDRRGNRLHLALPGTTAGTVRYTGLPWEWLGLELRGRPAGLTTVLLDLAADKAAWPLLREYGSLPASPSAEVYGVVSPPGFSGGGHSVSGYTRHWIEQLRRSTRRPANLHLHALTVGSAALPPGALVLPTARELAATAARTPAPGPASALPQDASRPTAEAGFRPPGLPGPPWSAVPSSASDEDLSTRTLPVRRKERARDPHPVTAVAVRVPDSPPGRDPRPHIHSLATAGRHLEAATLAQAWEQYVLKTFGYASQEATEWEEIRADLARMAGDFGLATHLWTSAGRARLSRQDADAPEVKAAAAGALYCWTQLKDPAAALDAGTELILLLDCLPSLDPRHLRLARQRLEFLHHAPSRR